MFEEHGLHLLDATVALVLAVGLVEVHADQTDVIAQPIQPQHLVTELAHGACELAKLSGVLVVHDPHLLFYLLEVGRHVRLHRGGDRLVHVVYRTKVPLVLTCLDLDEAVVVTLLHDRVVHWEVLVEKNVGDLLWDGVLPEPNQLLHAGGVVGVSAQLIQGLLAECDVDVHVLRVVDVVGRMVRVVYGVHMLDGRRGANRLVQFGWRGRRRTLDVSHVLRSTGVGAEALRTRRAHVGLVTTARFVMTGERPLIRELFVALVAKVRGGGGFLRDWGDGLRDWGGGLRDDLAELLTIVLHLGLVASRLAIEMAMQVRLARRSIRANGHSNMVRGLVFGS